MIISRTPYRISFLGGGTDYPSWSSAHGGAVLATTIDKYCWISCRHLPPFFDHRLRLCYSEIECCQSAAELKHSPVRAVLEFMNITDGVEIHHDGDLPGRSGMGSSSAFTVGLIHALSALKKRFVGPDQLAKDAIYVEQEMLKETVGQQDQIMAAHGGLKLIHFSAQGWSVRPVPLPRNQLRQFNDHLLLLFTGVTRMASEVAAGFVDQLDRRRRHLRVLNDLVAEGFQALIANKLTELGKLLHEGWEQKRSLGDVSTTEIDDMYAAALECGAIGGKLLGAGKGGFLLLFAPPDAHAAIAERLGLLRVPFNFESQGSQIIFAA